MNHRGRYGCKIVGVGRDSCYVRFARTAVVTRSSRLAFLTARGDAMVLDFDSEMRVVGIELVGDGKPCQDPGEAVDRDDVARREAIRQRDMAGGGA